MPISTFLLPSVFKAQTAPRSSMQYGAASFMQELDGLSCWPPRKPKQNYDSDNNSARAHTHSRTALAQLRLFATKQSLLELEGPVADDDFSWWTRHPSSSDSDSWLTMKSRTAKSFSCGPYVLWMERLMMSYLRLSVLQGPGSVVSDLCAKLVLPANLLSSQDPCLGLAHYVTVIVVVFYLRRKTGRKRSQPYILHHTVQCKIIQVYN